MNQEAFDKFKLACEEYLESNGWLKMCAERTTVRWRVPKQFGIHANDMYVFDHAIETQMQFDCGGV